MKYLCMATWYGRGVGAWRFIQLDTKPVSILQANAAQQAML